MLRLSAKIAVVINIPIKVAKKGFLIKVDGILMFNSVADLLT